MLWREHKDACIGLAIPALQLLICAGIMHGLATDSRTITNDRVTPVSRLSLQESRINEWHDLGGDESSEEFKAKCASILGIFQLCIVGISQ